MSGRSMEDLRRLSDEIEEEETGMILEEMVRAFIHQDDPQKESGDLRRKTMKEKQATMLLRCLRIHMCLELVNRDPGICRAHLRRDWDEIIECLTYLEYSCGVSNEILSDAVDLITLLDPGKRRLLLKQLDLATRLKIRKQTPLRRETFLSAVAMAEYCLQTQRFTEAVVILCNLAALSEERNAAMPKLHREVVIRALGYLVDVDKTATCQVAEQQRRYFEGVTDRNGRYFEWFRAYALLGTGRIKEAMPHFRRCHELCVRLEGEDSWLGARSGAIYHYDLLDSAASGDAEAYLWDLLEKIDAGFYRNVDESAGAVAAQTRGMLLRHRMDQQRMRGMLPQIMRLRDFCVENQAVIRDPSLTVRHVENVLSAYYMEMGDYLQAAAHGVSALESVPPNGMEKFPPDILIYSNLFAIYMQLNDLEQMRRICRILTDYLDDEACDDYMGIRICMLLGSAAQKLQLPDEDIGEEMERIRSFYQAVLDGAVEPERSNVANINFAQWTLSMVVTILDSFSADRQDLICCRGTISYFLDRPQIYPFTRKQIAVYNLLLAQTEWQLGGPDVLKYLQRCMDYSVYINDTSDSKVAVHRLAAVICHSLNRRDQAMQAVSDGLSCASLAWQNAVAYLNDHKICQLLSSIQRDIVLMHGYLRCYRSGRELYESVLRFKNLAALVGRERNRILRLVPVDDALRAEIFRLQDQLAAAELEDSLKGTDTANAVSRHLQALEADFSRKFPREACFTEISLDRVYEHLPDDAALVEYYFVPEREALDGYPADKNGWALDIFVLTKIGGSVQLRHLKNPAEGIGDRAEEFVEILQNPGVPGAQPKKAALRALLYRKLLAPVMPYLEGVRTLYIAPDQQLCNLPFEILYADGSGRLQDRFKICRLVCGRDLLFFDDSVPPARGSFILGDPNYEAERGERVDSFERHTGMNLVPVKALPFSGVEARRVARRCGVSPCTGLAATKFALQDALPCGIIHVATHGVFDIGMRTNSLYSSHLVFAGYNQWVSRKTESTYCGNGVLTADEISRMDLSQTGLVVLSACQTGLEDTSGGSNQGFTSAFSAAGVRWVVSHMWKASDFTTPIFMDAFYEAYLNMGMDVPDALQYAKQYLQNVTVEELLRGGWLDPDRETAGRLGTKTTADIAALRQQNPRRRPFADEFYWGGFVCHQCK